MTRLSATVIICAYTLERWAELTIAMSTVQEQAPTVRVILVIDHNEDLYERSVQRWPEALVVKNVDAPGLSSARNTGLALVSSEVVVFLDDDAYPLRGWLPALLGPLQSPEFVAVGGAAYPIWPSDRRPAWLPEELLWIVGCSFEGQPRSELGVRNVMGCNMAFRTEALREVGGFNPAMGRIGSFPVGGEETEVCLLLQQRSQSARIGFTPASAVNHHVTRERTTFGYLVRRSFCEGLSKAQLASRTSSGRALSTETGYVTRVLPAAVLRELARPQSGGLLAAAGICVSVVAAGWGYLRGLLSWSSARRRPQSREIR